MKDATPTRDSFGTELEALTFAKQFNLWAVKRLTSMNLWIVWY